MVLTVGLLIKQSGDFKGQGEKQVINRMQLIMFRIQNDLQLVSGVPGVLN